LRNQLPNLKQDFLVKWIRKSTFVFNPLHVTSLQFLGAFAKTVYKRLCYRNSVLTFCHVIRAATLNCPKFLDITIVTVLGVKAAGAYSWKPCQLHVPIVQKFWEPQPPGTLRVSPGMYRGSCSFNIVAISLNLPDMWHAYITNFPVPM
jgi:hypothetical protein